MALIPLQLPAGIYRNGTEFQSAGRWRDSNLVRWIDNTMQPIKGWAERTTDQADAPLRGSIAWRDNLGNRYLAAGNASQLVTYLDDGTLVDITPTGLTSGSVDATENNGFGGYLFGRGYYGTERPDTTSFNPATTWALDTWGEYLVACSDADGKIYEWQLDRGTPTVAAQITNAPTGNRSIVTTDERFIFALGAGGDPRKVQWCDREDNTTWTPLATNEAGDIILQTFGDIECGHRVQGQTIILTTQDAHTATYIGGQFVYSFERVGTNCGIMGKKAATTVQGTCFWMGKRGFFMYQGGAVKEIQSEVDDYVFSNINRNSGSKVAAVVNSQYNEVWWFYPSDEATENDSYVVYNYLENFWYVGHMGRTTGVDHGIYRNPIYFCAATNRPFDHETGYDYHNLDMPWAESGAITLGNGDNVMVITEMIPDELTQGDVRFQFKSRFYPNGDEYISEWYDAGAPTSVRVTGRQIRIRVEGVRLSDWRVGTNRIEVKAGGKR